MILYLDSSALVKMYVAEEGHDQVVSTIQGASLVTISVVGYAEARSALARRHREGRLNEDELRRIVAGLNWDWFTFEHTEVIAQLTYRAGNLAEKHALRGFDAIHLASALLAKEIHGELNFFTFDKRLNEAARAESLTIHSQSQSAGE